MVFSCYNKKLIRRWDSERELSLRQHRTRTTKYNRLVQCINSATTQYNAQKAIKCGKITQPLGLLRRSRSFKVTEFGTNRKLICDFLLVINSNLPPIFHRFRDIALERSKIANFLPLFGLTPRRRGSPGTISVNFIPKSHRWPRYQTA